MKYFNKKSITVATVFCLVFVFSLFFKNTIELAPSSDVVLAKIVASSNAVPAVQQGNLLNKITQAQQILRNSALLRFEEVRIGKTKKKQLIRKQIALAILNQNTGEIFERRVWVKEADIKNYKKTGYIPLAPNMKGESLDIRAQWWNSFNTPYQVTGRPELVVLANKYLLPTSAVPYPSERSKTQYSEMIYTPFSEALLQDEIINAGKDHINNTVDSAFEFLKQRNVLSQSVPGKLVTDVVNKDFIKNIVVVEHVDPDAFAVASDSGRLLTQRVLTIVGANTDRAFSYTGSPAGASGIAQFIKSTYDTTRKNYPTADLIPDFNFGMADHQNAFKAMVLFFDSHKKEIEDKITRKDVLTQLGGGVTEEMLALAYNGGPKRVIKSVNTYGLAWISGQLDLTQPAIFRPETLGYFNKFRAIKSLNIF